MLTRDGYISLMQHAIGGATPATGHSLLDTLDRAGRELFGQYPWPWLVSDPVTLLGVSGSYDIDLPPDFGSVVVLTFSPVSYQTIQWTTPDQVFDRRRLPAVGSVYFVSVHGWSSQATPGVPPTQKLIMDRVAPTDGNPTFTMIYKRQWASLADGNSVPNMPSDMEDCLVLLARAKAWALENDGEHPDMERATSRMRDQWKQYGRSQTNLGALRGGAGDRLGRWTGRRNLPPGQIVF